MSDYYKILGVSKSASKAEIKKAFRVKAKEHHPDKGGEEAKFKEINKAYETLSDETKKAHYDQFGSDAPQGGRGQGGFGGQASGFSQASGGFGGFEDIFSSFFGGEQGARGAHQTPQNQKGSDLEVDVEISFEESMEGVSRTFSARRYEACSKCDSKGGSGEKKCETCDGVGTVNQKMQTPFGIIQQKRVCHTCHGQGKVFEKNCKKCEGSGRVENKTKIEIQIPQGVDDNMTLRLQGKGDAGKNGGPSGDLFVHISVKSSNQFKRQGLDLVSTLEISIFDAILGGSFEVQTFWEKVSLNLPEKTKDGQVFRISGKGVKSSGRNGDHYVKISYLMPKKISAQLKETLETAKKQA